MFERFLSAMPVVNESPKPEAYQLAWRPAGARPLTLAAPTPPAPPPARR